MEDSKSRGGAAAAARAPHVLIFPLPLQGPVNTMLHLAELLLLHGDLHVTFLNTDFIQHRLSRFSDALSRFSRFHPFFRFETIPDGLPDDCPRGARDILQLSQSLEAVTRSRFKEMVTRGGMSATSARPITCIIADGLFGFVADVAKENRVPLLYFDTISPCGLWTHLCVPRMIHAKELPFQGDDLDEPIKSVPGMESFLRRRDLPSFCRSNDLNSPTMQLILYESQQFPSAQGHILNTFLDLDSHFLPHLISICPNLYLVGPIHHLLKTRLEPGMTQPRSSSNSLWEEDSSCIAWLDKQPLESVIFVSIGSLAVMSRDQVMEFWHGLANSGVQFLWVQRPGSVEGMSDDEGHLQIPLELLEGTEKRGCIVSWAPQEKILAHPAVGGFLTHSGWNSTVESIIEGVPMICWPYFVDQQVNSRHVSEVWKIGMDMKDTCDRVTIEKMVRALMDKKSNKFSQRSQYMAKSAKQSVTKGGPSYRDIDRLIDDIKYMRLQVPT